MKKLLLFIGTVLTTYSANAQVSDTVSTNAGYTNQKWYSLQNDEQGTAPKNNWDIAFQCGGGRASIIINAATGTQLWLYPGADTAGWATLDTAGLSKWSPRNNSDTSWTNGAFNVLKNTSNSYDVGWGIYSMITHYVTGDSLFVIKLANNTFKKLWIVRLAGGVYTFRHANLNGSSDTTVAITKSSYAGKNFAYYSLQNNTAIDREPLSKNWDLTFTQYMAFLPQPYIVTGALANMGIKTAKAYPVDTANIPAASSYAFTTKMNGIGYDWKKYNNTWSIEDSLVYFVKTSSGDIWSLIFTGFGGGANGSYIFSKEKLPATSVDDVAGSSLATMSLYPNPANSNNTTLVYALEQPAASATLKVLDVAGRLIYSEAVSGDTQLNTRLLNTAALQSGIYFVTLSFDGKQVQQKLIVQ